MPICCATGAVWLTRLGGSKMQLIESFCKSKSLGWTEFGGGNYEGRQAALTTSNSSASAFVTSVKLCLLPSKIAGLRLLSRFLCPDGKKRRHPKKNATWVKQKYFRTTGAKHWVFTGEVTYE